MSFADIDLPIDCCQENCDQTDVENCCNGNDISANNVQDWFNLWNGTTCQNLYSGILFTGPTGSRVYNPSNLNLVQDNFCDIFYNYTNKFQNGASTSVENKFVITNPGLGGYNIFQETIHDNCKELPGACDISLQNDNCDKCGKNSAYHSINFCQPYSRDFISKNPGILEFCGCFAPIPSNQEGIAVDSETGSQPQCDTLCTPITTVKLPNGVGDFLECNNSVCVMDNISIQATESSVGGGVTFTQVCRNCIGGGSSEPCTCIIAGVDIQATADSIGLSAAEFNQFCGQNSTCLTVNDADPNEPATQVSCQNSLTATTTENDVNQNNAFFWLFVIALVLIILAAIVSLAAYSANKKSNPPFNSAAVL